MALHDIFHGTPADSGRNVPATSEELARQEAVKQIERRHRFWIGATMSTLLMVILVFIWATAEYHNAGGWPTQGFSDSSSIPNVWNDWIIYPAIAWVLFLAGIRAVISPLLRENEKIPENLAEREATATAPILAGVLRGPLAFLPGTARPSSATTANLLHRPAVGRPCYPHPSPQAAPIIRIAHPWMRAPR